MRLVILNMPSILHKGALIKANTTILRGSGRYTANQVYHDGVQHDFSSSTTV